MVKASLISIWPIADCLPINTSHNPLSNRQSTAYHATMLDLLEGGTSALGRAREAFDYASGAIGESMRGPRRRVVVYSCESIRMMAPLPNPPSLRDFIAFEDHIAATSKKRGRPVPPEWYKAPGIQRQPSHDHWAESGSALAVEDDEVGLRTGACLHYRSTGTRYR